jgi:hypothetical protein
MVREGGRSRPTWGHAVGRENILRRENCLGGLCLVQILCPLHQASQGQGEGAEASGCGGTSRHRPCAAAGCRPGGLRSLLIERLVHVKTPDSELRLI